ncbi:MAG: DTW domain-containing protein [Deltaproteobacteria bacterium]|nr:DTW domain-containing protein [Deltaproteobacteria bacterium]
MRASRHRDQDSHCPRCGLRREICICAILPTVPTRTEFVILRHIAESRRPSNTGRFVLLALPNSRMIACGGGDRIGLSLPDDEWLRAPGTCLLWPDGPGSKLIRPERIVVLDATWRQARRLFARTPALSTLPRLVLPAPAHARDRLREQHRPDGMSTLEAVAAAVAEIEGAKAAEPLERLYDEVVRRTIARRWGTRHPDHTGQTT